MATAFAFLSVGLAGVTGCSGAGKHGVADRNSAEADILYRVGDSVLTVAQVVEQIPRGLETADSAALFQAISDDWLYAMLLEKEAALNYSDYERIESQVRQYRRRLLAARYRESIVLSADDATLAEDSVRAAYESRRFSYALDAPMVKGILLQIPDDAPHLDDIRALMKHPDMAAVDRMEKLALDRAVQYECFIDEWQDWRDIAALVPYRFPDADSYVASHPSLETHSQGSVYLLTVTAHMPAGSVMPYEKAAPLIRAELLQRRHEETDRMLLRKLRQKAVAAGTLKVYTPKQNKSHAR